METNKENKNKNKEGKLVKISEENHTALKTISAKEGYKMEHLTNTAVEKFIETLERKAE